MQAFRRPVYSSVIFRLRDTRPNSRRFKERSRATRALPLKPSARRAIYFDQSEMMAKFLRILGSSLTIIFSLGA